MSQYKLSESLISLGEGKRSWGYSEIRTKNSEHFFFYKWFDTAKEQFQRLTWKKINKCSRKVCRVWGQHPKKNYVKVNEYTFWCSATEKLEVLFLLFIITGDETVRREVNVSTISWPPSAATKHPRHQEREKIYNSVKEQEKSKEKRTYECILKKKK